MSTNNELSRRAFFRTPTRATLAVPLLSVASQTLFAQEKPSIPPTSCGETCKATCSGSCVQWRLGCCGENPRRVARGATCAGSCAFGRKRTCGGILK
ncbi:MAG: hypothetical protein IJY15_11970 [Thermoguttaceae bacterium]|nr:hypothetical protein [Thermoguttaceae bacterium]